MILSTIKHAMFPPASNILARIGNATNRFFEGNAKPRPVDSIPFSRAIVLLLFAKFVLPVNAIPVPRSIQPRVTVSCVPATWEDIIFFFLANYVAHVATIKSYPGQTASQTALRATLALFYPFSGIAAALFALTSRFGGKFKKSSSKELDRAVHAGAFLVVARSREWQPQAGEEITGCKIRGPLKLDDSNRARAKVAVLDWGLYTMARRIPQTSGGASLRDTIFFNKHVYGQCSLPAGYELWQANVEVELGHDVPADISSNDTTKQAAAIIQLLFAIITLVLASSNEFSRYGYASFSLTVLPYALMSLINLIAALFTPSYSHMIIVRSEVLEEARARGGVFSGTFGVLTTPRGAAADQNGEVAVSFGRADAESGTVFYHHADKFQYNDDGANRKHLEIMVPPIGQFILRDPLNKGPLAKVPFTLLMAVLLYGPYVIIAALTGFSPQHSTASQRAWTMSWLVTGQVSVAFVPLTDWVGSWIIITRQVIVFALFLLIPAIGGFVTVGMMIKEFGSCTASI
jgi:hypothetical protein